MPRRIIAKVEHHHGELFPRVGFIVTNMTLPSRAVVRFYNERGTAEQWGRWIGEGRPMRLSVARPSAFQADDHRPMRSSVA